MERSKGADYYKYIRIVGGFKCTCIFSRHFQKIEVDFFTIEEGVVPLNKTKDYRFYSPRTHSRTFTNFHEQFQTFTMTQSLIFKLAERVLFDKNGGSKKQKTTIIQNMKAIRKALKCPKDSKGIQRKPSAQVILAALNGRGWHHRTTSTGCLTVNEGGDGMLRELAMYGGVIADASGHKQFKVTDRRLQKIWNAISKFIQEYGTDLQLCGDLLAQQASILVLLNRRYQQVIAQQEANSFAFTQEQKKTARLLRVQQGKEARAAVRLQALIRGALARSATLKSTLADLSGCFGEWDDEEDMEEINERHTKMVEEQQKEKQKKEEEEAEWLDAIGKEYLRLCAEDSPKAEGEEEGAKKKKKKRKKKKSHQVRKMEAAKARKKAGKKAGKR